VTENVKIYIVCLAVLIGKMDKPLFPGVGERRFIAGIFPAGLTKKPHQRQTYIRMYPFKSPLTERICKNSLQQFVSAVSRSQTITMAYKKVFSFDGLCYGCSVGWYVQFIFKIPEEPHIVIARKKINGYAHIPY